MDYTKMTMAELEAENQKLDQERQAIREKMLAINAEMTKRKAEDSAKKKYDGLSDAERDALHQIVGAAKIESAEKVN